MNPRRYIIIAITTSTMKNIPIAIAAFKAKEATVLVGLCSCEKRLIFGSNTSQKLPIII
jgi:hypothetical protein